MKENEIKNKVEIDWGLKWLFYFEILVFITFLILLILILIKEGFPLP